jgi:CHAT domain-containing protein
VDENEQYLLKNYTITYVTTGRDLLRLSLSNPARQSPVLFANPNYDRGAATQIASKSPPDKENRSSADSNSLQFGPLEGTKQEAEAIMPLLKGATLLTQAQASENALKQVSSPQILHLATHGFFLEDVPLVTPANPFDRAGTIAVPFSGARKPSGSQENPLLRSGIALAGANQRRSGSEDGVLTALEATNLKLRGTKLVVLSACETGVGDVPNGDGVYGLRRAFVLAGSESQVFSLWKVDDYGTKELMVKYYQRLLRGEGRSEALRQVQLEMLASAKYQHPFYWSAFLPSGDWRGME